VKALSGKHLCSILEAHGWLLKRIRGSHHIYAKPGLSEIITVPVHGNRDLKRGLLSRILKDAGLTDDDL
jgi:predicted RNA binding protein YcfA (HicA-like mRNA interferase family)